MEKELGLINPTIKINENVAIVGSSKNLLNSTYGEEINQFDDVIRFNRAPVNGFENFVIINCHISSIETLFLHSAGHVRAKYIYENGAFHGEWLVP